jgi:hypothetical protein
MAEAVAARDDSLSSGGCVVLECGDGQVGGADRRLLCRLDRNLVSSDLGGRKGGH